MLDVIDREIDVVDDLKLDREFRLEAKRVDPRDHLHFQFTQQRRIHKQFSIEGMGSIRAFELED